MTDTAPSVKVSKLNKSATYLYPLMNTGIGFKYSSAMENCFVEFDEDVGKYPFGILIDTMRIAMSDDTLEYQEELMSSTLFLRNYIIGDGTELYIFEFPEEFISDYILFKKGKYSEMSKRAKDIILNFTILEYKYHPITEDIAGVLWKKQERRIKLEKMLGCSIPNDLELTSIMDVEKETFKFNTNE